MVRKLEHFFMLCLFAGIAVTVTLDLLPWSINQNWLVIPVGLIVGIS